MTKLVQDWFRAWEDRPGVWVIEEPLHPEEVKSYLVLGSERAALIDTGIGIADIRALVEEITSLPVVVLQSHAHYDHMGGAWQFDDVAIHPAEADDLAAGQPATRLAEWFASAEESGHLPAGFKPLRFEIPGQTPTRFYNDGDSVQLGGRTLGVMHLPGHSPGGLAFLDRDDRTLYSTDVVYLTSLYLLHEDCSLDGYVRSLERLDELAPCLDRLYPSHGPTPIEPVLIGRMLEGMRSVLNGRTSDGLANAELGLEETSGVQIHRFEFGDFRILVHGIILPGQGA